ncbi:ribonuclease E activity regulator RraA [Propioniciclava sp. MC1595]|uniref:ribonuclease E activity regulator RraA n=1 Tax=unclassified Propioniciclava TaxID=2642922 RepID=UPI0016030F18|nr:MULTISPECIES: ribonuclease E activity regulator RraA [unclassified Propioniciclava]MBB1495245.1 ribonuclease E activity regulator RraA [Propioniciclava sp. MC1595]MBB1502551.1 ribonuclease E activity regulator RraA [Propioniciclava sp. MC1683]QTE26370.1 ribonuclease E activity regulator RraA [Propioniciclava sp. MC1595]
MIATADIYDQHGEELASCSTQFRDFGGRRAFTGVVETLSVDRDNQLVKEILNTPGAGKVLVVDGQGSLESALMGDMIAAAAVANGWEGVIIHGAVRDSVALGEMDLGVKALGTNPRKSAKDGVGARGGVVSFGGADFAPGATVWADPDGILVTRA